MAKHHNKPDKHSTGMNHHNMSKEQHKECHISDGQRHAEGMKQLRHDEQMHEAKNTGK